MVVIVTVAGACRLWHEWYSDW